MGYKKHFKFCSRQDLLALTTLKKFETRLGERVQVIKDTDRFEEALQASSARFVLVGIPEDIGVIAENGGSGSAPGWQPFLSSFLNIQSNDFLEGSNVLIAGYFDFSEISALIEGNAHSHDERIDAYRHAVNTIDEAVEPLIKIITQFGKIPVVIGGGHNNSYPLIRGAAKGLLKAGMIPLASINCVNLDWQAEFRPMDGRHSGNGFTYAEEDGYLQKYCCIGLSENYLTQNIWMDMVNNPFFDFITYEDIFIHEKRNFLEAVAHATSFTEDTFTGIELDLDFIESLSNGSAAPGVSTMHARQFVSYAAADLKPAYLHICQGSGGSGNSEAAGKLTSYLVSDFLKALEF